MFREMRRFKQQVSEEECIRILTEEKRAAFSVIGEDGYPYTIPVNYFYVPEENAIYLHGARVGHKIDAIRANNKVCFTVWNQGFKKEGHWEWNATSVVVFGKAVLLDTQDPDLWKEQLRRMAAKYYPTMEEVEEEMTSSAINHVQITKIEIDHMTGKLVNEK